MRKIKTSPKNIIGWTIALFCLGVLLGSFFQEGKGTISYVELNEVSR